jgi:Glycosyl hydrolases family 28
MQFQNGRDAPIAISQCTTFNGEAGNCTSSQFLLENLTFNNLYGTSSTENIPTLQCSGVAPCENITISNVNVTVTSNNTIAADYLCGKSGNVDGTSGFNCTGPVCVVAAPMEAAKCPE